MKTQRKNITEEIERMKSLFTEERLYGNLVEQDPPAITTINKRAQKETDKIAANQAAGQGKTTRLQRKALKQQRKKDDGDELKPGSLAAQNKEKNEKIKNSKNCKKGITNLAKNFLAWNMKKRPTIAEYTTMIGGDQAYAKIKEAFNKCKEDKRTKDIFNNGTFGDKTVLKALDDIINSGDTLYLKVESNDRDYAFLGSLGIRAEKGERLPDIIDNAYNKGIGQGINIKNAQGKTIGKIMELGNNKYKVVGDKKQYFLNSQLNQVRNKQLPNILTALKNPNGKITVVANTGKREKYRDSFEFTVP